MAEAGDATVLKEVDVEEQQRAALTDGEILRLAQIGVRLEKMYGNARDIEWALLGVSWFELFVRIIIISIKVLVLGSFDKIYRLFFMFWKIN